MSVSIDVLLKTDDAEKEANEFQQKVIEDIKKAAETSEELMQRFFNYTEADYKKLAISAIKENEKITKSTEKAAKDQADALKNAFEEIARAAEKQRDAEIERIEEVKEKWQQAMQEDIQAFKQRTQEEQRAAQDSSQAWEKRSNDLRGFIGDMGDAVGLLGNQFLGLSKAQQASLENTISLAEKGMALGAALGPLGALIGGVTFAVIGYTKALKEKKAAEETKRFADSVNKASGSLGVYLDTLFDNGQAIIKTAEDTQGAIDSLDKELAESQIVPEDFSKKSVKTLKKELSNVNDALVDGRKQLAASKANLDKILKDQNKIGGSISDDAERKNRMFARQRELQAAADEEKRVISNLEESAKQSLAQQKALDAEIKSRNSKAQAEAKKNKEITLEQLDAIVQAEREQEERMAGVRNGKEMSLKAEYDAEQKIRQYAMDTLRYYQDLELIAVMEQQDKLAKVLQDNIVKQATMRAKISGDKQREDRAKEAAEIEAYAATVNGALDSIGQMSMNAIGGVATDAFNSWLEAVATGEKDAEKSFKKIASAAIRNIGSELVADGVKNILKGSADLVMGRKTGPALIGIGTAEVAAGVGMGAAGARAQRRQGYGDENKTSSTSGTLGKAGNANAGTQVQAPSIINLGLLAITDQRQLEQAGKQIAQAQSAYAQGRR